MTAISWMGDWRQSATVLRHGTSREHGCYNFSESAMHKLSGETRKGKRKYLSVMGFFIICMIICVISSVSLAIYRYNRKDQPPVVNKAVFSDGKQESRNSPAICPQCGQIATLIPPAKKISDNQVESTFKCPLGHIYTEILPIK